MKRLIFSIIFLYSFSPVCLALEQTFTDLPCSLEVLPVFSISLDKTYIDFGLVQPGETKILGEPGHFNEIRCRSNYGRTWYLKAEIISGPQLLGREGSSLPPDVFKFKVVSAQARSEPKAKFQFESLEKKSDVIYVSQADENTGKEVILRFQYSFKPPENASSGNYAGQILFTLTDSP